MSEGGRAAMERHMDRDLAHLKEMLIGMGRRVEGIYEQTVVALLDGDSERARLIVAADDEIDQLELDVDDHVAALSTMAPVASDLRFVMAVSHIAPELEHVADLCQNIAERVIEINRGRRYVVARGKIPAMTRVAAEMLDASIAAFAHKDPSLARKTIRRDEDMDRMMAETLLELEPHMAAHPEEIPHTMRLTFIAKYLERIADAAVHVCEQVIYEAEGIVAKHHALVRRNED